MKKEREDHALVLDCLEEATITLLSKKNIDKISISELTAKAGVSRISFYRNYNKIEDILINALSRKTNKWWEDYQKKNNEGYDDFLKSLFGVYKKEEKLIKILYKEKLMYIIKEHIFSCCEVETIDDDFLSYQRSMFAGCIYGLIEEWIRKGMKKIDGDFTIRSFIKD